MKTFLILALVVLLGGCVSQPDSLPPEAHPELMTVTIAPSPKMGNQLIEATVRLSKPHHRLVLIICRSMCRPIHREEIIQDTYSMSSLDGKIEIKVSFSNQPSFSLNENPAVIFLYHRDRHGRKMKLGRWMITDTEIVSSPKHYPYGGYYLVQSGESSIGWPN